MKTAKYHITSVILIILSFASLYFFIPSAMRGMQAVQDVINSVLHIFTDKSATVAEIPSNMDTVLPLTVDELKTTVIHFGKLCIQGEHWLRYLNIVGRILLWTIGVGIALAIISKIVTGILKRSYSKVNTDYNMPTKPLKVWLSLEDRFYYKPKKFVIEYWSFLRRVWAYLAVFLLIWAWNLNLITILIEFIAFVIYFFSNFDIWNILVQVAKLAVDLTVVLRFIPLPVWLWVAYKIFDKMRKEAGFSALEEDEEENQEFLEENPGNLIATGKPRVGKTQTITDMQKSQEVIFRKKAKERCFERAMEFPFFSWTILEQSIMRMRKTVPNFCLEFIREWLSVMRWNFIGRALIRQELQALAYCKMRSYGYIGSDFIFNYDYKRYGLEFNNNLKVVELHEAIEGYSECFYAYTAPTPLIFNNYPVRTDIRWFDEGNYPLMDYDFFRRDAREWKKSGQFSHVYYFDMGRLGKKKDADGDYVNNFEFGVVGISEAGKEFGNQKSNAGMKTDGECNAINDLAVLNAKMQAQGCMIDDILIFRVLMDEQRSGSLQADMLELGSEMKILKREKAVIKMPFFEVEALIYEYAREKMVQIYDFMKYYQGRRTLCFYIALRIYAMIRTHYIRVFNQFSSEDVKIKVLDHSNADKLEHADVYTYHLSRKKLAGAYETAFFKPIYKAKARKSRTGGINQVPMYDSTVPSLFKMKTSGSHFYDNVFKYSDISDLDNYLSDTPMMDSLKYEGGCFVVCNE